MLFCDRISSKRTQMRWCAFKCTQNTPGSTEKLVNIKIKQPPLPIPVAVTTHPPCYPPCLCCQPTPPTPHWYYYTSQSPRILVGVATHPLRCCFTFWSVQLHIPVAAAIYHFPDHHRNPPCCQQYPSPMLLPPAITTSTDPCHRLG